jgi:hypothetical protein
MPGRGRGCERPDTFHTLYTATHGLGTPSCTQALGESDFVHAASLPRRSAFKSHHCDHGTYTELNTEQALKHFLGKMWLICVVECNSTLCPNNSVQQILGTVAK